MGLFPAIAVFAAAVLARLPWLGQRSFWFDEFYTANLVTFKTTIPQIVSKVAQDDAHPPLFYLITWIWAHLTGIYNSAWPEPRDDVEFWLRLSTVLTGALVAVLTYVLAKRFLPAYAAFLAGLFYALHPYAIFQDTQARMYPMLTLAWLLMVLALDNYRRNPSRARAFTFGAAVALGIWTQYLAFFLATPAALFFLAIAWPRRKADILYAALLPATFLAWVPSLLGQLEFAMGTKAIRFPVPFNLGQIFDFLAALDPLMSDTWKSIQVVAIWLLAGLGWYRLAPKGRGSSAWAFNLIVVWPVAVFLIWWAFSTYVSNLTSVRYGAIFVPFGAIALAAALDQFRLWFKGYAVPITAAVALSVLFVSSQLPRYPVSSENWKGMAAVLRALDLQPGDVVMSNFTHSMMTFAYYYRPPQGVSYKIVTYPDMPEPVEGGTTVYIPVRIGRLVYNYNEKTGELAEFILSNYQFLGRLESAYPIYIHIPGKTKSVRELEALRRQP
ncbi:glycosyltransferase family 39 protein [Deinococcota bacterium DY0809b]